MSALDLVRALSSGAFLLVAIAALANYVRARRRDTLAALLFFGALGLVIVVGLALPALGIAANRAVGIALIVVLLAIPVLELNLVALHASVNRRAMPLALAGFAISAVPLVVWESPPAWIVLPIVAYFFFVGLYAAVTLVREARARSGPTRERVRFGAAGALLLGLSLVAALLRPVSADLADVTSRLVALACALSFLLAFAPPSALRRAWLEPLVRNLLLRGPAVLAMPSLREALAAIESGAVDTMRAQSVFLRLPVEDPEALRERSGDASLWSAAARALDTATPIGGLFEDQDGAVVAMPIAVGDQRIGALAVRFARPPMFADATRDVLTLVAMNAAVLLTSVTASHALQGRNDDLERANRTAQEATKAKSEFLANMSHELRTPLNSILGFSDLLSSQLAPTLSERHMKFLKNIRDAGDHLLRLINDVLDLSKVEARRLELRRETVPLDGVLADVTAGVSADAERRGLRFEVEHSASVDVDVDPLRFRQILLNLLTNALKFTPAPGIVTLRAASDGDALAIEVQDTGMGIPANKVSRVFATFERLHEGRHDIEGTGLGLALTKQLVELHGGTIDFVTTEGRGTCFRVRLPNAIANTSGERVLVVEDEARDAELIVALAKREGLGTEVAATLESARRAIQRRRPIGIVLDLRLPDGRGDDLLRELDVQGHGGIPTIVVTVEDDEGASRVAGADDHLTKPLDHERLSGWLRQIAARSRDGGRVAVAAR